jgi:hypothetical protein
MKKPCQSRPAASTIRAPRKLPTPPWNGGKPDSKSPPMRPNSSGTGGGGAVGRGSKVFSR